MNEKTKAFIEAVSKTITSEKLFREVITPAQNTFTPSKDIELDREAAQKAIGEALSLLPDAHTAIIWVTNGAECALVDTVAFPNSGDESTCFVAGYAPRSDVSAEFFAKRLADYGAFENVDEDTEADVFSYLYEDEEKGKGNYESGIRADTEEELEEAKDIDFVPDREINLATARLIREALSDPDTLENIKEGTITTKALINSILSNLEPEGITSPVDMAIKTLQMSQRETANESDIKSDIKSDTEDEAILKEKRAIIQALDVCLSNPRTIKDIKDGEVTVIEAAREVLQVYDVLPQAVEEVNEIMSAKKRIVEAVEAAAADTANADNCIADYYFTIESVDEDGKNIKKLSIVFEN